MSEGKKGLFLWICLLLLIGSSWSQPAYPPTRNPQVSSIIMSTSIFAPDPITVVVNPSFHDTILDYGDSLKLSAPTIVYRETRTQGNDTLPVDWELIPQMSYSTGGLRSNSGFENVFYAGNGLGLFLITASVRDLNGMILFSETMRVSVYLILPPMQYSLWIESDTNIGWQKYGIARLNTPAPVPLVSIPTNGGVVIVAAVKRDKYGNFVGFPSNALWQVIGDTGIIHLSCPEKPYLCAIEGLEYGSTLIRLSDDSGSLADTVPVENGHGETSAKEKKSLVSGKSPATLEYYNLRGQKLRLFGNSRVEGIVLERTIGPGNKLIVKRKF